MSLRIIQGNSKHTHTHTTHTPHSLYPVMWWWHLVWVQILAIVISAADAGISLTHCVQLFWVYPGRGIAGSYTKFIYSFLRNRNTFFTVAAPTVLPFLHILPSICYSPPFGFQPFSQGGDGVSWWFLICISLMTCDLQFFMYLLAKVNNMLNSPTWKLSTTY